MAADMESRVAVLETRVQDLVTTAGILGQLPGQVLVMQAAVSALETEVRGLKAALDQRSDRDSQDRRAVKVALIGLAGMIVVAMIGAYVTLSAAPAGK